MYIPLEKEDEMVSVLLESWEREKGKKNIILHIPLEGIKKFPALYPLGVLGVDWPGMLETVTSVVHNLDWNICYIRGFTLKRDGSSLFLFLLGVEIISLDLYKKFKGDRVYIKRTLELLTEGHGGVKQKVLLKELRKLPRLEETLQCMRDMLGGSIKEELEEETLKFFVGRTEDYLSKRAPKYLARQIFANYRMKKKVRDSGGVPQVNVDIYKIKNEKYTGVSISGLLRDLSLTDCLETIEELFPGSTIIYSKEFITSDGITNYRIELERTPKNRAKLEKALKDVVRGRKMKRQIFIEEKGGVEQYARIIIPHLIKENAISGIPQVFIVPLTQTKDSMSLKLIIVHKEGEIRKIVHGLQKVNKFSVKTVHPTRNMQDTKLDMLDIDIPKEMLEDREKVYPAIKSVIHEEIGTFRDFDEGMRTLDMTKLKQVEKITKTTVPKNFLRSIYYNLEGFYRVRASVNEITTLVRMGYSLYKRGIKRPEVLHVVTREEQSNHKFALLGVATKKNILADVLELMSSYKTTTSSVNIGNMYFHLFRLEKSEGQITRNELNRLVYSIKRLV